MLLIPTSLKDYLKIPTSLKDYLKQSYVSISFAFINVVVFLFLINQSSINFQTLRAFNAFYAESVLDGSHGYLSIVVLCSCFLRY